MLAPLGGATPFLKKNSVWKADRPGLRPVGTLRRQTLHAAAGVGFQRFTAGVGYEPAASSDKHMPREAGEAVGRGKFWFFENKVILGPCQC